MMDVGYTVKLALLVALGMRNATFIFCWVRSVHCQATIAFLDDLWSR